MAKHPSRYEKKIAAAVNPVVQGLFRTLQEEEVPVERDYLHQRAGQLLLTEFQLAGDYQRFDYPIRNFVAAATEAIYLALAEAGVSLNDENRAAVRDRLMDAWREALLAHQAAQAHAEAIQLALLRQTAGLPTWAEAQHELGWSDAEMRTAKDLGVIFEAALDGHRYSGGWNIERARTAEGAARVRENTLLSRLDAAAYLGISEAAFDRRRKQAGIDYARAVPTRSGWPMYLYRLSDVESLREPS